MATELPSSRRAIASALSIGLWLGMVKPCPAQALTSGFDASHFQASVNFGALDPQDAAFAYLKATQGTGFVDPQYRARLLAARKAGVLVGAYHFYDPSQPPEPQLQHFVSQLDWQPGDLPPVVDIEYPLRAWRSRNLSIREDSDNRLLLDLKCFLGSLERSMGLLPIVYSGEDYAASYLRGLARYPLWLAEYRNASTPQLPRDWPNWLFWQYSQTGRLTGIKGPVDLSRFNGSLDDLRRLGARGRALETADDLIWAPQCQQQGSEAVTAAHRSDEHWEPPPTPTATEPKSASELGDLAKQAINARINEATPKFIQLLLHSHGAGLLLERIQAALTRHTRWTAGFAQRGWGWRLALWLLIGLVINALIHTVEPGLDALLHGKLPLSQWLTHLGLGTVITVGAASLWSELLSRGQTSHSVPPPAPATAATPAPEATPTHAAGLQLDRPQLGTSS